MSSSGHVALIPELAGWNYPSLDPELRKSFEVALHAATAAALVIALRRDVAAELRALDPRGIVHLGLTFAPAAVVGLGLERQIESRLGTARSVAAAQALAGAALLLADRRPSARTLADATWRDHLAIGFAQSAALVPGVSRGGATLTAARLLRFRRHDANRLSRRAALPVIAGATTLKTVRLARRGVPRGYRAALATGSAAAFATTLASAPLAHRMDRARSYAPLAAYRIALGAWALRRGRGAPGRAAAVCG